MPEFRWVPPSRPKGVLLASTNACEDALAEVESLMVALEPQPEAQERLKFYVAALSQHLSTR